MKPCLIYFPRTLKDWPILQNGGSAAEARGAFEKGSRIVARRLAEALLTATAGAVLGGGFIYLLVSLARSESRAALCVGWCFFFWPGVIDSLRLLLDQPPLFEQRSLVGLAAAVGGLTGLIDGWNSIHDLRRRGAFEFALDVTWGLAHTTQGCLLHLCNIGWAGPIASRRLGLHRYRRGFCFHPRFAVTLGSVCSNLGEFADADLLAHEREHVRQNRLFGPIYLLTYLGWILVLLPFAAVAGVLRRRPARSVFAWCYVNNPWEEWAYRCGGLRDPDLVWPWRRFVVVTTLFFVGAAFVAAMLVFT